MSQRSRTKHETKASRRRRRSLLKAGIWVFLAIFAFSVVGGLGFFAVTTMGH